MRFSKDLVEDIRSRNDIVEFIGTYVNLKRAGFRRIQKRQGCTSQI